MTRLVWDQPGERVFETGVDRAVLHFPEGGGVPWNGLISIDEDISTSVKPVYFDGIKINDIVVLGDFSGTMKAYTYPDEFLEYEGILEEQSGYFMTGQSLPLFHLSYRTMVGDDVSGMEHYKIHILFNLTAVPSKKSYKTLSLSADPSEFQWTITSIPEEADGYRPTSHVIIDSRKVDPWLLADIEAILYGDDESDPSLPSLRALTNFIRNWDRLLIIDNGDGTWTANAAREGYIEMLDATTFQINDVNGEYLDASTYEIFSTEKNEDDLWLQ